MFKTNEYFDGKVRSIAFDDEQGPATVGVMAAGEYEFGTSSIEHMTVISGMLNVMLPGDSTWKLFKPGMTFVVPANIRFRVKCSDQVSYLCLYR